MTKMNKILLPVFIIIVNIVILTIIRSQNTKVSNSQTPVSVKASESNKNKSLTQENEGGNVKITVTPKTLAVGEKPSFDIVFETHSVDLSFDVTKISLLVDDQGKTYTQSIWTGSPQGGHHREGTLTFDTVLSEAKSVELIIKDIAGVAERKFKWSLSK